jgi:hypothetical protein
VNVNALLFALTALRKGNTMSYVIEVFDNTAQRIGYAWRGKLTVRNTGHYPHPSSAAKGVVAYLKTHPEHHCFVNRFKTIRHRFGVCFPPR